MSCIYERLIPDSALHNVVTVFGLVHYAENALQQLETEQRRSESLIRKEARVELSRRGIVPTETAIARWRAERARELEAAAANDSQSSTS